MTMTKLQNMINPEVLASMVDGELEFALKFTNLATVDNTLAGRPGNTVSLSTTEMTAGVICIKGMKIPARHICKSLFRTTLIVLSYPRKKNSIMP